jgi:hypothetical protein
MSLAEVVATGMLVLLVGFVAMVIYATLRQLGSEARDAAERREL